MHNQEYCRTWNRLDFRTYYTPNVLEAPVNITELITARPKARSKTWSTRLESTQFRGRNKRQSLSRLLLWWSEQGSRYLRNRCFAKRDRRLRLAVAKRRLLKSPLSLNPKTATPNTRMASKGLVARWGNSPKTSKELAGRAQGAYWRTAQLKPASHTQETSRTQL